jgi:PLD-like domain
MTESTDGVIRKHRGLVMCGLILTWLILTCPMSSLLARAADNCPTVAIYFTPGENCPEIVVKTLGAATTSIVLQAYAFTSAPIAKALVDAMQRGVRVEAILDKSNRTDKYSAAPARPPSPPLRRAPASGRWYCGGPPAAGPRPGVCGLARWPGERASGVVVACDRHVHVVSAA